MGGRAETGEGVCPDRVGVRRAQLPLRVKGPGLVGLHILEAVLRLQAFVLHLSLGFSVRHVVMAVLKI